MAPTLTTLFMRIRSFSLILCLLMVCSVSGDQSLRRRALMKQMVAGGSGGANGLLTGLAAYWTMDEASGATRDDSTANNQDLTDVGTVAATTGKLNNGADFEITIPNRLTHADSATLSLGADTSFTISAWVKLESDTGFVQGIVCKNGGADNTDEYYLTYDPGPSRFRFKVANGSGNQIVDANAIGAPSTATWYHIVAIHNAATDQLSIIINDGTPDTAVWSGGTQDGSAEFRIGAMTYNNGLALDGVADEVGFWKVALSGAQVTTLYGGGTPPPYSSFD